MSTSLASISVNSALSSSESEDRRWCVGSSGRIGEYGVIGAEQSDESHYDDRSSCTDYTDGRLSFVENSKKLYGREKELEQLANVYNKLTTWEEL